jgi:hypothetical protein
MLPKLDEQIANALERAAEAERRARGATDPQLRLVNERLAQSWRLLAGRLQYAESLEMFLIDSQYQRDLKPPALPKQHPWE